MSDLSMSPGQAGTHRMAKVWGYGLALPALAIFLAGVGGCIGVIQEDADHAPAVEANDVPRPIQGMASALTAENRTAANGAAGNGTNVNGITLNGINPNGIKLNGINLNGINLNGINLNGINLNGLFMNGINLNGINLNGINLN